MHNTVRASLAFCTIVSKNYLPQARVLAESLRRHHPGKPLFVLLADRIDEFFDPGAEPFHVIELEELFIHDLPRFCFQYTVLELNTAAKPYFLEHLFQSYGFTKLIYLDPDIMLLDRLDGLFELLDIYSVLLTPHLIAPYPQDGRRLSELDILRAGTYNLGFLALADGPTTASLLDWWKKRLYTGCRIELERGMHVDQKWIDLVPGFFPDVFIVREPGYNIAYWNLDHRKVTRRDGNVLVNGSPAYFYHFSGFDPARPELLSKHQDRLTMHDIGEARQIFTEYQERLRAHGATECGTWPYAYGLFDNGVSIQPVFRRIYLELGDKVCEFGNPFLTGSRDSYFHYLTRSTRGEVPALFREIRRSRPDLMGAFPDVNGADRARFLDWVATCAQKEYNLDERLLPGLETDEQEPAECSDESCQLSLLDVGENREERPFGVNLAGYFQSEKGVGEAARAVLRALESAAIPFVLNNVLDRISANRDTACTRHFADSNPFAVNLIQVNADLAPLFAKTRPDYLKARFNVGYWNWELSDFPSEWRSSFAFFDEIWVPSTFTKDAVAAVSPIPVRCVPFAISVPQNIPAGMSRERFGLPHDAFLFLFAFDFHSYLERKNPLAVIEAFRRAFGDRQDVGLVLKSIHAQDAKRDWAAVQAACGNQGNVKLIDRVLNRGGMHGLMMLCDAYVSLHRAEGYGLGLAEAMAMGKPVIGTAYSANMDFMNARNSCPVRYRLIEIDQDHGPYHAGALWADPDVGHAAEIMFRLVEDRQYAREVGENARQDIARELSPARVGETVYSRLVGLTKQIPGNRLSVYGPARSLQAA